MHEKLGRTRKCHGKNSTEKLFKSIESNKEREMDSFRCLCVFFFSRLGMRYFCFRLGILANFSFCDQCRTLTMYTDSMLIKFTVASTFIIITIWWSRLFSLCYMNKSIWPGFDRTRMISHFALQGILSSPNNALILLYAIEYDWI